MHILFTFFFCHIIGCIILQELQNHICERKLRSFLSGMDVLCLLLKYNSFVSYYMLQIDLWTMFLAVKHLFYVVLLVLRTQDHQLNINMRLEQVDFILLPSDFNGVYYDQCVENCCLLIVCHSKKCRILLRGANPAVWNDWGWLVPFNEGYRVICWRFFEDIVLAQIIIYLFGACLWQLCLITWTISWSVVENFITIGWLL